MSISQAVILAAGMGTRLGQLGEAAPKGFIELDGEPIIRRSIAKLSRAGITRIVIATGHLSVFYLDLAAEFDGLVRTVHNDRYADSGSMYSLYLAQSDIDGPFLLLESDLIYEYRALDTLLRLDRDNALLLSGYTGAGDEVYVAADKHKQLTAMSKVRRSLPQQQIAGELVGISKISSGLYRAMCAWAETRFVGSLRVDYETDALVAMAADWPVFCHCVEDLLWSEIDDENHLRRARALSRDIMARDLST